MYVVSMDIGLVVWPFMQLLLGSEEIGTEVGTRIPGIVAYPR